MDGENQFERDVRLAWANGDYQLAAQLTREQVRSVRSQTGDSLDLAFALHSYLSAAINLDHSDLPADLCELSIECLRLFEHLSPLSLNVLSARFTVARCILVFSSEPEDLEIAKSLLLPLIGDLAKTTPQTQEEADRLNLLSAECCLHYASLCITMKSPDAAVDWLRTSEQMARAAFQGVPELLTQHLQHCLSLYRELKKARVALAKLLYDAPNLLILDEPTNHLDIITKRALVKALAEFEGTLVFVSHDRQFLSALATRVLELAVAAPPRLYGGSYDEYVATTGREAPGMRQQT